MGQRKKFGFIYYHSSLFIIYHHASANRVALTQREGSASDAEAETGDVAEDVFVGGDADFVFTDGDFLQALLGLAQDDVDDEPKEFLEKDGEGQPEG